MNEIIPFDPVNEEELEDESPRWYDRWRKRIHNWVSRNSAEAVADVLLLVPDMFMLMVRLVKDRRVPIVAKGQLLVALAYVLSPFDLIPEAVAGVLGLTDDAGVMALVLLWLQNVVNLDQDVIRENWSGRDDPTTVIEEVNETIQKHADEWFSARIWHKIRAWFMQEEEIIIEQAPEEPQPEQKTYRRGRKIFTRIPIS